MTLDAEDVDAIARREAELIGQARGLVDAQTVAAELQVEREWVYTHARELGAVRLGNGPKARLLFDPRHVRERVTALAAQPDSPPPDEAPRRRRRRSRTQPAPPGVKLIQGRSSR